MDLLSIAKTLWRHKLIALPVILLTMAAAFYVVAAKPKVYEATTTYVLLRPPSPPSATEIAKNPALASVHADNIYNQLGDMAIVAQVVTGKMGSDSTKEQLRKQGVGSYKILPLAGGSPLLQVLISSPTPDAATKSRDFTGEEVKRQLYEMQKVQGIDDSYMIKILLVNSTQPRLRVSSTLRTLIAVLGLGAFLIFIVVSIADAIDKKRAELAAAKLDRARASTISAGNRPVLLPTDGVRGGHFAPSNPGPSGTIDPTGPARAATDNASVAEPDPAPLDQAKPKSAPVTNRERFRGSGTRAKSDGR